MGESSALGDVIRTSGQWRSEGRQVVLARVVAVSGSAPQPPGTSMAISDRGEVIGSLSGGCVESSVVDAAERLLTGTADRIMPFGWGDEDAYEMGLSCGGRIDVLLTRDPLPDDVVDAFGSGRAFAMATVVEGLDRATTIGSARATMAVDTEGNRTGTLGSLELDDHAASLCEETLATGDPWRNGLHTVATESGEVTLFVEAHRSKPVLIISGAVDVTASALVRLAKIMGFHTIVCDPRSLFATTERLVGADEVLVARSEKLIADLSDRLGPNDALCVLTHRFSFDIPVITAALATDIGYIGALGSRGTANQRRAHLLEEGVTEDQLARLHAPIGLDIGANTPEEIALSVMAEIIANRSGRDGSALRDGEGRIHKNRSR